jgi:hypothetical protein
MPPPQLTMFEWDQQRVDAAGNFRADCWHLHEWLCKHRWATPLVKHVVELNTFGVQPLTATRSARQPWTVNKNMLSYSAHRVCMSHKLNLVLCGSRSLPWRCPQQTSSTQNKDMEPLHAVGISCCAHENAQVICSQHHVATECQSAVQCIPVTRVSHSH